MFDPELKYCLQCQDEYVPRIVDCPVCGSRLLTGREVLEVQAAREAQMASRTGTFSEDDEIVAIQQGSLKDMRHLEGVLVAEKIAAEVAADESSCGKGCCATKFFLKVKRQEAYEAMEVLQAEFARATALEHHDTSHCDAIFNPYAEETTCPACGFRFQPTTNTCPDCGLRFG